MLLLAALHVAAHVIAPPAPPREPAVVRTARTVVSTAMVCLAARMELPADVALEWLKPLTPLGVGGHHRYYLTFDGTPIILMYDMDQGLFTGVAPPDLLWPMVVRPRLFAGIQGRWRAGGFNVYRAEGGGWALTPIGYETVLVRGNLLCHGAVGTAPVPGSSFLVTAERRWGLTLLAVSYPCQDDRDLQAKCQNPLHFRRALVFAGPVILVAGLDGSGVELAWWHRSD